MVTNLKSLLRTHYNSIRKIAIGLIALEILIILGFLGYYFFKFISIQEKELKETLSIFSNYVVAFGSFLLIIVTLFYVLLTRSLVEETRKTREAQEKPYISFRIIPDESDPNFLKYSIKNSGTSGAFDIHISLDHDLSSGPILGPIPKSISYLGPKEEIGFLFAYAPDYFKNPNSIKEFIVNIKYSKYPISAKEKYEDSYYEPPVEYVVNVEELRAASFAGRKSVHDIAKELTELKQGVFLIGQKLLDLEEQHLKTKKR